MKGRNGFRFFLAGIRWRKGEIWFREQKGKYVLDKVLKAS